MPGYVKIGVALIVGALISWVGSHLAGKQHAPLTRARDGIVIGGYALPIDFDRVQIRTIGVGLDNVAYEVWFDECSAATRWNVSVSGDWAAIDEIRPQEGAAGFILEYEASSPQTFLRSRTIEYKTRVYVEDGGDTQCLRDVLTAIFEGAKPVFALPS
tara:strand:+ start:85 stop:558 length:474 start_codon:yes stop_codon:yes gene_type:complete